MMRGIEVICKVELYPGKRPFSSPETPRCFKNVRFHHELMYRVLILVPEFLLLTRNRNSNSKMLFLIANWGDRRHSTSFEYVSVFVVFDISHSIYFLINFSVSEWFSKVKMPGVPITFSRVSGRAPSPVFATQW